jgi:hypothetical protein
MVGLRELDWVVHRVRHTQAPPSLKSSHDRFGPVAREDAAKIPPPASRLQLEFFESLAIRVEVGAI